MKNKNQRPISDRTVREINKLLRLTNNISKNTVTVVFNQGEKVRRLLDEDKQLLADRLWLSGTTASFALTWIAEGKWDRLKKVVRESHNFHFLRLLRRGLVTHRKVRHRRNPAKKSPYKLVLTPRGKRLFDFISDQD